MLGDGTSVHPVALLVPLALPRSGDRVVPKNARITQASRTEKAFAPE